MKRNIRWIGLLERFSKLYTFMTSAGLSKSLVLNDLEKRLPHAIRIIALIAVFGLSILNTSSAVTDDDSIMIALPSQYIAKATAGSKIHLDDLATSIEGKDAAFIDAIKGLILLDTPEEGQSERFAQHQVLFAIRTAGFDFHRVHFEGAKLTEVFGPGQKVTLKTMVDAIFQKLLDDTGWDEDDVSLQVLSAPTIEPWLPPDDFEIHVNRVQQHILGTSRYNVRFVVDKIVVREETFIATVAKKQMVYLPAKTLQRGEVVTKDDVREEIRFIDKPFYSRLYVGSLSDVVGKKARTLLREGETIKWTSLETNYIVRRGDRVQMVVRNGGMVMHTAAKVQDRGAPGQIINVKSEGSGKVVKAKVIHKNLVELISS